MTCWRMCKISHPQHLTISHTNDAVGLSRAKDTKWQPYRIEQNRDGFTILKERSYNLCSYYFLEGMQCSYSYICKKDD